MTLDDSVSEEEEEEESSFDELTDVTPYLQPGVELSVLIQVRQPAVTQQAYACCLLLPQSRSRHMPPYSHRNTCDAADTRSTCV